MAPAATSETARGAGVALCLVSACGFGLMAIIAKEAYAAGLGVTALLAARFVLAASLLWALVAMRARRRARATARASARPGARLVVAGLALGAIGYAAQAGLFFSALRHIDASLTSLLLYTYPALVFCGAVALRREHVTRPKALALALASAGAALVLLGGGTGGLEATGVALALGAGATYAVYILVSEGIVARLDAFLLGALVATGGAATFLVAGLIGGSLAFPAGGWIWIAAIALFSTVLPIVTFLLGMERVGASTASILSTLEPVVTVGLAVALYSESLGPWQILGGGLVLAAVIALQARGTRAVRPAVGSARVAPAHAAAAAPAGPPACEPARG
ncbi:MAG: DMT family transporter [Solirubrobacteraceae bacterium]|nr:DMT family transporter [Solirubrobacteraceae bacterium]